MKVNEYFANLRAGIEYGKSIEAELTDLNRRECVILSDYCLKVMTEVRDIVAAAMKVLDESFELRGEARLLPDSTDYTVGSRERHFVYSVGRGRRPLAGAPSKTKAIEVYHDQEQFVRPGAVRMACGSRYTLASIDEEIKCIKNDFPLRSFAQWVVKKEQVDKTKAVAELILTALKEQQQAYIEKATANLNKACRIAEEAEKYKGIRE